MPLKKSAILLLMLLVSSVGVLVYSADKSTKVVSTKECSNPVQCSKQVKEILPAGGVPSRLLF